LDPFEQHDDATLNDALRAAGLFSLQEELGEARLTLDSNIASGGSNLSVGQRQILALARAMVRESKLLILDEGSSHAFFWERQNLTGTSDFVCSYFCDRLVLLSTAQYLSYF
jgi:ABC-type thiamine transport system ATPase subunit